MTDANHGDLILDQFTRQATVFSTAPAITDEDALRMIVEAARPASDDRLLDVACGPGLVVCAFAPHVREAIGIDVTPAMLDRACKLAADKGLANVAWRHGDVYSLPYGDARFTIITTQMVRVCAPGGRIVVVDDYASEDPAKAAAFNRLEKLRDPSHSRCLTLTELKGLFGAAGLPEPDATFYELRGDVPGLLARSFPNPGDDVKIIEMFKASAADGRLGVPVRLDRDEIYYAYPVAILAASRPA
jgi:SAM-dependent methyltransferase